MTDQEDKIYQGKFFFDDNIQDRKLWSCLEWTCSRFLVVFPCQLVLILVVILYTLLVILRKMNWRPLQIKNFCQSSYCWKTLWIGYYSHWEPLVPSKQIRARRELQNTHIVLSKYPRDLIQVSTVSAQLRFWSELVDWYRDAAHVLCDKLLFDLSPRTDDEPSYCTNIVHSFNIL